MKVLITGGAGFIGSYLTEMLSNEGHEIFIIDNLNPQIHGLIKEESYLFNQVKDKAILHIDDINSCKVLDELIEQCDYIVHLAAETGTGQSMYEISNYVRTNSLGTSVILEKLTKRKHNVKKFILASSRAVYGEGKYRCPEHGSLYPKTRDIEDLKKGYFECKCPVCGKNLQVEPTDEESDTHPQSIYGLTKYNQEQLVALTCENIKLPYTIFRFQNVYGKGQSLNNPYTGILAIFSRLILEKKKIDVFEDGYESRDFIHVKDVVKAIRNDIGSKYTNQVYNIGSGQSYTVLDIVEILKTSLNSNVEFYISGSFRIGDIRHNIANISRAKENLNFYAEINIKNGIGEFTEWIMKQSNLRADNGFDNSLKEMKSLNLFFNKS